MKLFYTEDESDVTVVRPDIIIVCDVTKVLGKKNCEGPPDFILEIMSDSSKKRDFETKKTEYEKAGVKETITFYLVLPGSKYPFTGILTRLM